MKIIEYSDNIFSYSVKSTEEEKKIVESFLNFLSDEDDKGGEISYQPKNSHEEQQHSCPIKLIYLLIKSIFYLL